ncbi:putative 2,3-diaminopropionate biosynthesis protein SbnA [delta proteobacterium NaphS2]|nr:putative 2,3-diaminopropionate biosynthesis protein SbnA [delta proteobacterium NaphS2]
MTLRNYPQSWLIACAEESGADCAKVAQIGNTSIRRIRLLIGGRNRNVYLKLEGDNPGGSIKDRTALSLIRSLEKADQLSTGARLVESSSGNLAISLAMLARDRCYRFTAVVDPKITAENIRRLKELGAETILVEKPDKTGGYLLSRLTLVREMLAEDPGLVWTNQYSNAANPMAHYSWTAPEIFRQMAHRVDAVFVAVSTGGTLAGIGRYFRKTSPETRIIAVDARGSVALGGVPAVRRLTGMGSSQRSEFAGPELYDELIFVGDREAFAFCRAVETATGIKLGGSSGACLAACARYLQSHGTAERVVCICADRGEHYASSIFSDAWLAENGLDIGPPHLGSVSRIQL